MDNIGKAEILQIVDAVSRERGVSKAKLIEAMEQAVQIAGRKKYGLEQNISAQIDQNTGKISLFRVRTVVDKVENTFQEISLEDARLIRPEAENGEEILEPLPPIDLGRVAAQTAKQVIVQKVGEIERESQYEDYKGRKGDILNGTVKRVEFGNIIVDVGRAEALLKKTQQIRGEMFKVGDRVKAYVQDVKREPKGPQIFLSRTDDEFLRKLFEMEVPEVYDNIIEIKSIAREPGSKAKVAVFATDVSVDPVGSCVGVRGSRVKAITNELSGEKIDVISWDKNVAQFVINAMTPATISKIVFDEDKGRVEAIVPDDQLSLAIGRRGQNVRLASKMTGWTIDVMTEEQESKRRGEEFANTTELFVNNLGVDEVTAQLLSAEGYTSLEQIAYADNAALTSIEGFSNKELVEELQNRAITYFEEKNEEIIEGLEKLGVEQELLDTLDLPPEYILKLAEFGVKTIEDLGEVTVSEFRQIVPANIVSSEEIETLISFAKKQSEADE
ncbi:Transcription termination/antitermination protein NusA [Candidatus Megaera venefica]|uniref:Transcription termination/antitermination protein NusA n=1 Tax=Candidatus Megaera venefica TaxID=2055910 RepID=A0ABU5NDW4_9RICK|nr:transcription termination factor NusA [Candidatus Megaera venefica]MEA0971349.1 Transcription termination/antitermination protein NusA [Candidatus Megaera venefica]